MRAILFSPLATGPLAGWSSFRRTMTSDLDSAGSTLDHSRAAGVRSTVFGLDVYADIPVTFLQGAPARATGRRLDVSVQAGGTAALGWPDEAELVCEQAEPDGTVSFCIEAHPEAGYLIWGPAYGAHLLSADGRRLRCAPGDSVGETWQRLLIAQVLPFAALLRGLEVFHASAVVLDGHAVVFAGPSRTGKTSLALELCRLGASFLADDVLALERGGRELLGHPGTPVAGLEHAEGERLLNMHGPGQEEETVAVNARERLVRMRSAAEPAPLAALFFLDRRPDGPTQLRFEPVIDAQMLLAATFNFILSTPQRLSGLLDVCAFAAHRRVERILIGPSIDASELGAVVKRRLGTSA